MKPPIKRRSDPADLSLITKRILFTASSILVVLCFCFFKCNATKVNSPPVTPAVTSTTTTTTPAVTKAVVIPTRSKRFAKLTNKKAVSVNINDPSALKTLLLNRGIYFGTYLTNPDVSLAPPRPANYLTQLSSYFDLYSIPAWFHHTEYKGQGVFDFSGPDQVADFAVSHGAKIHAHNLVYNILYPPWLANGNFTPDQLQAILKTHVQTVVRHYRDKYPGAILAWDVVNEPVCDPYTHASDRGPTGLRITKWSVIHKPGSNDPSDYIELAFQWAHEADPNVKLYINEGGIEFKGQKWDALYTLVKKLVSDGVPINGIGFQCHFDTHYDHPFSELTDNMNLLAALGLQSQVTELDCVVSTAHVVPWSANAVASPGSSDFNQQARVFQGTVNACLLAKNCNAIIIFGAWDPGTSEDRSWKDKSGKFIGPFCPNILDQNMNPKPAYSAMVKAASGN